MIAVVKVGGHQALVKSGEEIVVDKMHAEVGATIELQVLLLSDEEGKNTQIGAPFLDQTIKAEVLEHGKGKKMRIFKMKPRKRYRRTYGHRQEFSVIKIADFGGAKKAPKKKAAPKKAEAETKEFKETAEAKAE